MTLRVRLALALSLLTAIAVTAMAVVGYRSTATRLYQEIDRSLNSSSVALRRPRRTLRRPGLRPARDERARRRQRRPDSRSAGHRGPVPRPVGGAIRGVVRGTTAHRLEDVLLAGRGPGRRSARWPTTGSSPSESGGGAVQLSRELDEVQHVLANLRVRFAVIGASITVLAALVGWWIASRVTRPVTRLTAATEAIAESGRLDVDVPRAGRTRPAGSRTASR